MVDVVADPATAPPPTRSTRPAAAAGTRPDDRWPDRFASLTFVVSGLVLAITVVPPWRRYFAQPDDVISRLTLPVIPNLVYGALLATVGIALHRRMRAAWWVLLVWWGVLPQLGRVVRILEDPAPADVAGFVLVSAVMVVLVRSRRQFGARAVRGSFARAAAVFLLGGVVTLVVGTALVVRFGTGEASGSATQYVFGIMLGDIGEIAGPSGATAPLWVAGVVNLIAAATVVLATVLLFRSPGFTHTLDAADEARVRTLLRDHGGEDSLGYFATRRDKAVVWDTGAAATASAGVSYRVVGSVCLASGSPVGDPRAWGAAIEQWRRLARTNGWSLAVMGANTAGALAYGDAGLTAWQIGDEAILDMRAFTLTGPGMKPVRQSVRRLQRKGYTTRVTRHEALDADQFAVLQAAAARWRGDGGDERGFSMALGRLGDRLDGDCVLVEALDEAGRLRGFLSFVPWGRTGVSLDLMRRDPGADNGLVELMVASLADHAAEFGAGRVSLNFAMFREAFERGAEVGAGPIARLWRQSLVLASRNWQLESLYRSNAKYQPEWQPRYICFEYTSDLPRVGTAAGSAEGFLTRPSLRLLTRRGRASDGLDRASEDYAVAVAAQIPAAPDPVEEAVSVHRLPEQQRVRRAKVDRLRARGVDPYPVSHPRTHTLAQVRAEAGALPPDTATGRRVSVTGRLVRKRDGGRLGFGTLRDGSGDLQVMVAADAVPPGDLHLWRRDVDLGDHLGVTGEVVTTRRGELSVRAESVRITSKSLRPLPDKHKGLTDPEARVRARYVDLIVRPAARDVAYQRAAVVRSLRDTLHAGGFTEVETPVLQVVHGGANARPFETHINAYDMDLYLRIATELHLKRLVVGGMEKVFEIGRQFRNEGVDFKHNPEFTSLEVYETYGDYDSMRLLTQRLIQEAATAVHGAPVARRTGPDGRVTEYDLSGTWPVVPVCEAVAARLGEPVTADTPVSVLLRHAEAIGLDLDPRATWGAVLEEIYGELCEKTTTTPVFYTDFPKENAPLTRQHRDDPRLAEKWDLVIFAAEQGTAYSELVDPLEQRRRLVAQSLLAAAGDPEAMQVDEDFLTALEYAMPPTGGMGLGVDRLVMNLTGLSIRDTILFPLSRPAR